MEDRIVVDFNALNSIANKLNTAGTDLDAAMSILSGVYLAQESGAYLRLNGANLSLKSVGGMVSAANVAQAVTSYRSALKRLSSHCAAMVGGVRIAVSLFESVENKGVSHASDTSSDMDTASDGGAYSIDSILFDDDGSYGGNQGSMDSIYKWNPIKCWELLGYLREYFPGMSILAAFRYFSRLNSVGCGYVALANTVFLEYEGRPREFERVFGYPMFKDGDLNYNRLILDIYATTDTAGFNDRQDGMPDGTLDDTRARIMENFLADKNVGVRTQANATVNERNFRQLTEGGGRVVLGYRNGYMYDTNGSPHYINGGHAITVTGVTDDGWYIVSSWGEQYYINASDIGPDDTFMVFYYDS